MQTASFLRVAWKYRGTQFTFFFFSFLRRAAFFFTILHPTFSLPRPATRNQTKKKKTKIAKRKIEILQYVNLQHWSSSARRGLSTQLTGGNKGSPAGVTVRSLRPKETPILESLLLFSRISSCAVRNFSCVSSARLLICPSERARTLLSVAFFFSFFASIVWPRVCTRLLTAVSRFYMRPRLGYWGRSGGFVVRTISPSEKANVCRAEPLVGIVVAVCPSCAMCFELVLFPFSYYVCVRVLFFFFLFLLFRFGWYFLIPLNWKIITSV